MNRNSPSSDAMKSVRRLVRFAMSAFVLLLGTQGAWAQCKVNPGYKETLVPMDMGRVVIPNETKVGERITFRDFPIRPPGSTNKPWNCLPNGGQVQGDILNVREMVTNIGLSKVFATEVDGVGIRLSRVFRDDTGAGGGAFEETQYPHTRSTSTDFGDFNATSRFRVELFKTKSVTGNGPIGPPGNYTQYYSLFVDVLNPRQSVLTTTLSGLGITIITPSCTVDLGSKNIPVDFGKVPQSNFKGKGTTTGDRKFNIKLNCKAGANAENTVLLRMDATQDPSNEQGVLKITPAGSTTATGVGIQVMNDKSVPVKFGETVEVGPSMTGSYVLPYTARYFQTGDKVTPGRADGTATFTLDYK
ncbi:type 1 fimbrial protein [Variovorax sp. ZS18.2.2]|uniref:fimbrial protein n=1 Tax=Variovorax sp. ZS18.2.2 TaxID=2971255 RepID=UPI002151E5A2|nr:fimbrial protein [Variovorax sp. ZS18.2.2]MCR6480132.1 type 1 fimbrial protein [Variovorax sp. ZS18.2.2]